MTTTRDDIIDQAVDVLGGEHESFIVSARPAGNCDTHHHGCLLLTCQVCERDVLCVGQMELWELIHDARAHWDDHHPAEQSRYLPQPE
jgi:hypothetical protein